MENITLSNFKGETFTASVYFSNEFKGRGGWNIICEVSANGQKKSFKEFTTNSGFIDALGDLRAENSSWETIQEFYYDNFFEGFEEIILEWLEGIK